MFDDWPAYLSLLLALWSAVIAGVFSAFSEFVMRALRQARPAAGIESMQHINRTVLRTQFVAGIVSIPPISIGFAGYALSALTGEIAAVVTCAAIIFCLGVFLTTVIGNVPMNNRLAGFSPDSTQAEVYWSEYTRIWTRLNHVRALASLVTAILYFAAATALIAGG